ncbi:MAG: hypothetical protein IKQ20_10705 [Bacteroidales bacterium]|nr:hypothetical protein [Bacteroidales bacterium]
MKKNILVLALAAITLCFTSCQPEEITLDNGNTPTTPRVATTADLIGTDWTATLSLGDLVYGMTGMNLNDTACPYPYANDTAMVCNLNFDTDFAHFTFSDNVEIWQMVEMAGQYTMEQIQQMDLAYVYDGSTQTGTLTAVGMDENGQPINYQINFSYDITADSITIVFQFTNEQNVTVNFPMVFQRNATV